MPTIAIIKGYRFFFFSNEGTEPPHVHVEKGDKYAKVWLGTVELAWSRGFRSHELNEILRIVAGRKKTFTEKWHDYFNR